MADITSQKEKEKMTTIKVSNWDGESDYYAKNSYIIEIKVKKNLTSSEYGLITGAIKKIESILDPRIDNQNGINLVNRPPAKPK